MISKQYRIMRMGKRYMLVVTHGHLNVETLGYFDKQAQARAKAKEHAALTGVKAIILT